MKSIYTIITDFRLTGSGNRFLAATARPLECDESVLTASRIAQHSHADLHILHVLESDAAIYRNYVKHYKTGEEVVGNEAYQQEVKQALYEMGRVINKHKSPVS